MIDLGHEPASSAVKAQSPNRWPTREFPQNVLKHLVNRIIGHYETILIDSTKVTIKDFLSLYGKLQQITRKEVRELHSLLLKADEFSKKF